MTKTMSYADFIAYKLKARDNNIITTVDMRPELAAFSGKHDSLP